MPEDEQHAGPVSEGPAPPKRIQQKLTKKVKFLQRVAASTIPKLAVKAGVAKKKKKKDMPSTLADLSTLVEGLKQASEEIDARQADGERQHKPGQSVGTLRARARVLEQEASRLHQVLHHPQFQADPLAAVKAHLTATLPQAPPRPRDKGPHAKLPRAEKKRRQKERRAAAGAMDEGE
ncbi:hypothetical protein N2152v2_006462 [Parachlorella kessleri]